MRSLPVTMKAPPQAPPLPAPFTRCPVCRGTTTMDACTVAGARRLFSVCHTCSSRWDLKGRPMHLGSVVVMPIVDPFHLPCGKFEGCSSSRPNSNAGRPRGSRDSVPRTRGKKSRPAF